MASPSFFYGKRGKEVTRGKMEEKWGEDLDLGAQDQERELEQEQERLEQERQREQEQARKKAIKMDLVRKLDKKLAAFVRNSSILSHVDTQGLLEDLEEIKGLLDALLEGAYRAFEQAETIDRYRTAYEAFRAAGILTEEFDPFAGVGEEGNEIYDDFMYEISGIYESFQDYVQALYLEKDVNRPARYDSIMTVSNRVRKRIRDLIIQL